MSAKIDRPYYLKCFSCGHRVPLTIQEYLALPNQLQFGNAGDLKFGNAKCPHCDADGFRSFQRTTFWDLLWPAFVAVVIISGIWAC
jgi:hypothetical protein